MTTSHANAELNVSGAVARLTWGAFENTGKLRVGFTSERNDRISKFSDVAGHPSAKSTPPVYSSDKNLCELWFPVVDVDFPGASAHVRTSRPGTAFVNGAFNEREYAFGDELVVGSEALTYWENTIHVTPAEVGLSDFRLVGEFDATRPSQVTISALSAPVRGELRIELATAVGWETERTWRIELAPVKYGLGEHASGNEREKALRGFVNFILRARHLDPSSRVAGGFNLFYDLDARMYRTPHWVWTWGVAIRLLLDAAKLGCFTADEKKLMRSVAVTAGSKSLEFQKHAAGHPADGLVTVRWSPGTLFSRGFREFISTSDAGFLAGWSWVRLYRETGEVKFLAAAEKLARAIARISHERDIVPLDFLPDENNWKHFILNEAGFGTEVFAAVYDETRDEEIAAGGRRFMDQMLAVFDRGDGLWDRCYDINEKKITHPVQYHTRGQGWAMEGLIAAHRYDPSGRYLGLAEKMGDRLVERQLPDGSWAWTFTMPPEKVGVAEKGTALWSYLLFRLAEYTGKDKYRQSAENALNWCLRNQYAGPDENAHGGLIGVNPNSGVVYRPWFPLGCTYAAAFAGLALLEKMKST